MRPQTSLATRHSTSTTHMRATYANYILGTCNRLSATERAAQQTNALHGFMQFLKIVLPTNSHMHTALYALRMYIFGHGHGHGSKAFFGKRRAW